MANPTTGQLFAVYACFIILALGTFGAMGYVVFFLKQTGWWMILPFLAVGTFPTTPWAAATATPTKKED